MNNTKMNNLRNMGGVTALLASTLAFANSVEAISLIGNYSSTDDNNGNLILSGIEQRAVGFTLPTGTSYVLDNITLRLLNYDTVGGDIAQLQIYADANRTSTNPTKQISKYHSLTPHLVALHLAISPSRPFPPSLLTPIPAIG